MCIGLPNNCPTRTFAKMTKFSEPCHSVHMNYIILFLSKRKSNVAPQRLVVPRFCLVVKLTCYRKHNYIVLKVASTLREMYLNYWRSLPEQVKALPLLNFDIQVQNIHTLHFNSKYAIR